MRNEVYEKQENKFEIFKEFLRKEKEMKKFFGVMAVVFLAVNVLFACGGMTAAPAPSDVPSLNVPELPNTPNIDNPSNPGVDNPSNPGVDNPNNPSDPSDGFIEDTVGGPSVDNPNGTGIDNPNGSGLDKQDGSNGDLDLGKLSSDLPNDKASSSSDHEFVATVL
ncbi:MAG: hypothetical protein D6785_05710 [Planctomycetota bacterium]|nr:MAG: hypothetical protein D6785_05710 [Planctomycetota bacterium]